MMRRYVHTAKSKAYNALARVILLAASILFWSVLLVGLLLPQLSAGEKLTGALACLGGWERLDLDENCGKLALLVSVYCLVVLLTVILSKLCEHHMADMDEDLYTLGRLSGFFGRRAPKRRFCHTPWSRFLALLSGIFLWGTMAAVLFLIVVGVVLPLTPIGGRTAEIFAFLGKWGRLGTAGSQGRLVILAAAETTGWGISILLRGQSLECMRDTKKKTC